MTNKHVSLAAVMAVFLFLIGCGHAVVTPQFADLQTKNVTIKVVDGDWTMVSGEAFKPQDVNAVSSYNPLSAHHVKSNLSVYNSRGYKDDARDVVVEVNGKEKLNGKIIFFNVYAGGTSASAKRKWTVSVPETYLNIARQGNVAVVYQPYKYNNAEWASWILWMSSMPL